MRSNSGSVEKEGKIKIEVNRTVFQSSVVSLPEKSPTTPELPSSVPLSPRVAATRHADNRD
ncbi:hypothetical protein BGX38DRAFT_1162846 [Terfezia claveryi]|nr:hypothetical protein BGX38DRAFT_1162846 [Terfezia claveryi]